MKTFFNMKYNLLKWASPVLIFILVCSCYKTSSLKGAGITVIQFPAATTINSYLTTAGSQTLAIVEIRRDVPNESVLNSSQTATIQLSSSVITDYNTAHGTTYTVLPANVFTFDASNPASNGALTLTFAPGEFAKSIKINIDLTALPASPVKSALGFTISNVSGGTIGSTKTAFVTVGAKNAYEASYSVTGFFFHPSAGRPISSTKAITTLSPTRCQAAHSDLAGYFLQFDVSATNTLTNYAPSGSTPAVPASGFMTQDNPAGQDYSDPSNLGNLPGKAPFTSATYNNTYVPASKTFWMHYGYQSGGNGEATFTRQVYEKWVRQ
jgi:hypothetical protein